MAKKNYKRLQFDFSEKSVAQLDSLVEKTDSPTRADLVRKALRFYEFVCEKTLEGYQLELTKDGERISLPSALL